MLSLFLRFNTANQTRSKSISILPRWGLDMWVLDSAPASRLRAPSTSAGFLVSQQKVLRNVAVSPVPFPSVCSAHPRQLEALFST